MQVFINFIKSLKTHNEHHIADLKIIGKLSQKYLREDKRNNPDYQANAKAIVLYFFELCKIGQKTDKQKKEHFDLFD